MKEFKIFFFAQRANARKQASSRRPLPYDALAPTVQNRASARCPDRTRQRCTRQTRQRCAQKTSSYITARPWLPGLIVGPCPSEESLCCPACPPPPPFFSPILGPRSLKLRISFPWVCSPPVCIIRSVTSLSLATTTWTPEHPFFFQLTAIRTHHSMSIRCHMCPWGRLLPGYDTRFFLQRGCCCQGKEAVPVDYIRGKGLSSRLTSGSKIRPTAGFDPCPQGPAPSSLAAAHSPF